MAERCAVCGDEFPFASTVHMIIHTQSDAGVLDRTVCKRCYDAQIEPAFTAPETDN